MMKSHLFLAFVQVVSRTYSSLPRNTTLGRALDVIIIWRTLGATDLRIPRLHAQIRGELLLWAVRVSTNKSKMIPLCLKPNRLKPMGLICTRPSSRVTDYHHRQYSLEYYENSKRNLHITKGLNLRCHRLPTYLYIPHRIYSELADEYKGMDSMVQAARRRIVADHLRDIIDLIERKVVQRAQFDI